MIFPMPAGLHRTCGAHHLHCITCSCYHRLPNLRTARSRDRFLSVLEQTRQRYRFVVVGLRDHARAFHLLITEPEIGTPSTVMQVIKQRAAHALLPRNRRADPRQCCLFGDTARLPFWQARFYDFNVWTTRKRIEKLRYMHRNPVKPGLVLEPAQWHWSSYRFYFLDKAGQVRENVGWGKISFARIALCSIQYIPYFFGVQQMLHFLSVETLSARAALSSLSEGGFCFRQLPAFHRNSTQSINPRTYLRTVRRLRLSKKLWRKR
jgi:putative transposase